MKTLLLVRAPGLTPDEAVRGDLAWNLSDLIAEGAFAPLSAPPDAAAATAGLDRDRVRVEEIPYRDAADFDSALGKLRQGAAGATIAILSESAFVSQHPFKHLRPGVTLSPGDLPGLLAEMLR